MRNSGTADLIRELFKANQSGSQADQKVISGLNSIVLNSIKDNFLVDTYEDLKQKFMVSLTDSFKALPEGSSLTPWNSCIAPGENNDKLIVKNFDSILRKVKKEFRDKLLLAESEILYNNVLEICGELIEEGFIKLNGAGLYQLASIQNDLKAFYGNCVFPYISILNTDGTIGKAQMTDLISFLFENALDTQSISAHHLTKLIAQITECGYSTLINDPNVKHSEEPEVYQLEIDEMDDVADQSSEIAVMSGIWFKRLQNEFDESELKFRALLFFMKYDMLLTVEEISTNFDGKYTPREIEGDLKGMVRCIAIHREVGPDDPSLDHYVNGFLDFLNEKYNFETFKTEPIED